MRRIIRKLASPVLDRLDARIAHHVRVQLDARDRDLICAIPGGVAVHTTEFNLSSNTDTLESPALSIYRQSDIAALVDDLERRGHNVSPFTIAPDAHVLDHFVDLPPYHGDLHLKLELDGYATTSVGLVITKSAGS